MIITYLDEVFRLVEQSQCGVPGAVRPHWHHVLQLLKAIAKVGATILLKLVVSGPENGDGMRFIHQYRNFALRISNFTLSSPLFSHPSIEYKWTCGWRAAQIRRGKKRRVTNRLSL